MPSSVEDLIEVAGLAYGGVVDYLGRVPELNDGVFLITTTRDPGKLWDDAAGAFQSYHGDERIIEDWLGRRPELRMDERRPTATGLWRRLSDFWLGDEVVLYIGATPWLNDGVERFQNTPVGADDPYPDPGTHWIKTLGNNADWLYVHYAMAEDPAAAAALMLNYFMKNVSDGAKALLRDPRRPLPFANMITPKGREKRHGLTGMSGPLHAEGGDGEW